MGNYEPFEKTKSCMNTYSHIIKSMKLIKRITQNADRICRHITLPKTVSVFIGVSLKEMLYNKALRPTQHSTRCVFKMLSCVRQRPNPCKYVR